MSLLDRNAMNPHTKKKSQSRSLTETPVAAFIIVSNNFFHMPLYVTNSVVRPPMFASVTDITYRATTPPTVPRTGKKEVLLLKEPPVKTNRTPAA